MATVNPAAASTKPSSSPAVKHGSSCLDKIIPDRFFAVKEDVKPITTRGTTLTFTFLLYILGLGIFGGLFAFYSLDKSQWESKILTQTKWQRDGFKCVPLQEMALHGLTTQWTYDECIENVVPPTLTNVVANANDWDYLWTPGGRASYASPSETVSNPTWSLDGYECRPSANDEHYGLSISYESCLSSLQPLSDAMTVAWSGLPCTENGARTCFQSCPGGCVPGWNVVYTYRPFALSTKNYDENVGTSTADRSGPACTACSGVQWPDVAEFGADSGACPLDANGQWNLVARDEEGNSLLDATVKSKVLSVMTACAMLPTTEAVCAYWKRDDLGARVCNKIRTGISFPTTRAAAVQHYKEQYTPEALCTPTKKNTPFQCTGSEPKGSLEILSLAYANAELVFALFGSLFVAILYKTKKAEDPDFLQEDELLNKLATLEKANATFETRLKRLESA